MSSYKTDVNVTMNKLYNYNQSIIIPLYVEYIPLTTNTIRTVKVLFYISEALPSGVFSGFEPIFQRHFCLDVFLVKFEYALMRYYIH
ncbi:MAG: hypothetical protein WCL21_07575 [Mariniphaga sp.]